MKTKKELKNEYKQMKSPMGVFRLRNLVNGKILIDSSTNMNAKWNRHVTELKFGTHRNVELQKDWKQFGEDSFIFEIVSELKQLEGEELNYNEELKLLEEMIVDEQKPFGNLGYNIKRKKH